MEKKIFNIKVLKDVTSDPRVLRFVASTNDVDRDGDIIDVDGWNLNEWNKNPVIMWAHDYSLPPIAKGIRAERDIRNNQLIIDARFPTISELAPEGNPSEHAKFSETIFQMYKTDCLNAVSVGCSYDKLDDNTTSNPKYANCRYHVVKQTLMELSCCPIGSNPNALRSASANPNMEKSVVDMVVKAMNIEQKAAIPFKHYPLADEDTAWDGPKVIADSDIEDLRVISLWVDSSKPEADQVKGDFKMPHHLTKADGYKTVKKGIVAAVGALRGARGGVDIPESDVAGCEKHARKHYEEFELDWPEDKAAWIAQCKALGYDDLIDKDIGKIETKTGRRLSAATMAQIDDLEKCMKELDEAIMACNSARDNMAGRIKVLKEGSETEETEEEPDEDMDGEKGVAPTVIKIVE